MNIFPAITGIATHRSQVARLPVPLLTLLFSLGGMADAQAGDSASGSTQAPASAPMSFLEGKTFSGELGPLGKPATTTDLLVFRDGMFVSEQCQKRCGYTAGPYWIRAVENGVQVKAETPCLTSDATIVWNGTIKGDEIEGTFTFTSKRWYWTVEKEFWFNGKLVEPAVSVTE